MAKGMKTPGSAMVSDELATPDSFAAATTPTMGPHDKYADGWVSEEDIFNAPNPYGPDGVPAKK